MYSKICLKRPTRGGPSAWRLRGDLTAPCSKKISVSYEILHSPLDLHRFLAATEAKKNRGDLQNNNFALVLCGCDTQSLIFMEKHGLRAFQNRVLRRILGPKRGEITGG
jgi:hypothetical protein